jgi:dihydroxyacetone kinase-like protein
LSIIGAEIIGTALLILLGDGVVAAVLLNKSKAQNSGWIVITFGWGFAVMVGAYSVGQFDGAHLNPAVTLGIWIHGGIGGNAAWHYFIGEILGAMLGATLVFLAYYLHWSETEDPGLKLAVFSTGPAIRNSLWNLVTEIIGTCVLVFGILAITAAGNHVGGPGYTGLGTLLVAFLVVSIGMSLGGPPDTRSTPPVTWVQGSCTRSCRFPARDRRTGPTPGFPCSDRSSVALSARSCTARSIPDPEDQHMKKLINSPDAVLHDALGGVEAAHGDRVRVSYDPAYVVRIDAPVEGKVGLISGGGSGHEPMHGGFVGLGMLDAACPGEVFTSPTPDQMLAATKAVDGGAGVIHIVKNYTGDVMNFDMAAEMGKGDDIEVETILTNDDVAVEDSLYTAGRRGVGVTVLVEKICGGAAEERRSLSEVAELGRRVNAQGRSMGMALTPCITPASGEPSFELAEDEVEIGIGIHGEPGRFREKIGPASQVVERLMTAILEDLPFSSGDRVLAFVNGMGGTPLLELYIVYAEVAKIAAAHGLTIERNLIGNYITSLEMQGCSITLVRLDDELVRYWDAPVNTPALRWGA